MKSILVAVLATAGTLCAGPGAQAQDAYPSKPVKLVVPFAAGGATDMLARVVAERLGAVWSQTVIVENRPGASGAIGSDAVAKSKGDGYTILLSTATTHAVGPNFIPTLPYKVERDFVPITELATSPLVLVVHPTMPANSVKEFVAYGKAQPGVISYNGATGTGAHMAMELLASRAGGISMQPVPYKGTAPALIDLVSGQLQAGFNDLPAVVSYVRDGKLRALAVTGPRRSPLLPQVPTVAESGFPNYDADVWCGLFAPAGTPAAIVQKIGADVRTALADPATRQKLENGAFSVVGSRPEEFSIRVKNDTEKWRKLIAEAGIKVTQ